MSGINTELYQDISLWPYKDCSNCGRATLVATPLEGLEITTENMNLESCPICNNPYDNK